VRGEAAADIDALLDLVVKLSIFAADHGGVIGEFGPQPRTGPWQRQGC